MSNYDLKAIKLAAKPKDKTKPYTLKKRSIKRIESDKVIAAIRKQRIAQDNTCKINSPVCSGVIECLNHLQKTSPKNREDPKNLQDACTRCNGYIELNVQWAIDNGHQISRFKK